MKKSFQKICNVTLKIPTENIDQNCLEPFFTKNQPSFNETHSKELKIKMT